MLRALSVSVAICLAINVLSVTGNWSSNGCQTPVGQLASNLDLSWITSIPKWYIAYGSRDYWLQNAEVCLGHKPSSIQHLRHNMCMKTEWDLNSTSTCFGKSITQSCDVIKNNGNPYVTCKVSKYDPGTKPEVFDNFTKRVVITDNQTYALFVRCADGKNTWYLGTTSKDKLPFATFMGVLAKLQQLNFIKYGGSPVRMSIYC